MHTVALLEDSPMRALPLRTLRRVGLLALAVAGGCSFEGGPPAPPEAHVVASVRFSALTDTLKEGDTRILRAMAYDASGVAQPDSAISYSLADTTLLAQEPVGDTALRVTGKHESVHVIIARHGSASAGVVQVRVLLAPVWMSVYPGDQRFAPGDSARLWVTVGGATGIPSDDYPHTLWSSDPRVIAVGPGGVLHALDLGSAAVTVRADTVERTATYTVEAYPKLFDFILRPVGEPPSPKLLAAFQHAIDRWERVLRTELPAATFSLGEGACVPGTPASTETVPGLLLLVRMDSIDGPGNVAARGGPCYVRAASGFPLVGEITIDTADAAGWSPEYATAVITHELGHVLGIGTLWYSPDLTVGVGGTDPRFIGPRAASASLALGLTGPAESVPLENEGTAGSRDAHWRQSVYHDELMTGWPSPRSPLSRLSVAALADLGYAVDESWADPVPSGGWLPYGFTRGAVAPNSTNPGAAETPRAVPTSRDRVVLPRFVVDAAGRVSGYGSRPTTSP